ncbi:MAG TPA: helix-turn-helix transcriptional regulator [Candidatus Blautia faecavium]|uniref:Helix-turn-helix transcriptional regulator n=1 Tax=Candidatus Blautia faecavium TaxID=2838487 RepID=A0A9D2LQI4_9FIRM|nr:helix-turn-helix transcriptional regulator [Candidatus Blautia faecavium]
MNYAAQLLSQRDTLNLSIGDIASMCGYYDPRYFSRIFKKIFGISPSAYPPSC